MTATRSMSDEEIAASIASSYAAFGPDDWNREDPYQVADWAAILTPTEFGAWQDIRAWGLPLWPRLPVGDFTISFGHPIARVALRCGEVTSADHWLTQIGWRVIRATASQCTKVMEEPCDVLDRLGEVSDEYRARYQAETLAGVMQELRHALIARGVPC
ncbi:hypothetical protein GIY62_06480 [Burkholderia plantarii]|uniref:hypothetical protein n=1 Tax=Burkholderia plantarii TaxID=41899 RepID=UPI00272D36BF|nr:hypothetical protein [Burkholderia plantarii]WLE60297.1 hypothetical protein GIY62_06480 [Burkholderia plantarii]